MIVGKIPCHYDARTEGLNSVAFERFVQKGLFGEVSALSLVSQKARLQIIARTRLGTGLANLSEWGLAKPIQARLRRCSGGNAGHHKGPRKPLAPPALHSHLGNGKRDRRCPRRTKQPGGGALANLHPDQRLHLSSCRRFEQCNGFPLFGSPQSPPPLRSPSRPRDRK